MVPKLFDPLWPIMGETDVDLGAHLQQLADIQLPDMVDGRNVISVVWQSFVVGLPVVVTLPDARHPRDSERSKADDVGCTHEVDVGGHPTAVIELGEVIARLMVATDEQCQIGSNTATTVVLMKIADLLELVWNRETSRIIGITQSLV